MQHVSVNKWKNFIVNSNVIIMENSTEFYRWVLCICVARAVDADTQIILSRSTRDKICGSRTFSNRNPLQSGTKPLTHFSKDTFSQKVFNISADKKTTMPGPPPPPQKNNVENIEH